MPKKIFHLTIEHLYYLLQNDCYLTFKADGVYKLDNEFNGFCEIEKLKDRELIFDYQTEENKNLDIISRINEYCNLINFDIPIFNELTIENFEYEISKYIDFYSKIKDFRIPKLYFKIKNEHKLNIICKINNYFPQINFPTDGWVIVPNNKIFTAKIKPLEQMTIDLRYKNRNFYDSNNNIYVVEGTNLKNNIIYRCYFKDNKWFAREERYDKRYPNSKYVIDIIQNQINFKLNLDLLNENFYIPYYKNTKYDPNFFDFFDHINFYKIKYLDECKDSLVLDVGCGKNSNLWNEIMPKKVIGLDIDPICIFKSSVITNTNNYIWFNFNNDWNIKDQIKYFGKLWEQSQIFKFSNLYNKFDYIIFNFSIQYCNDYSKLINNLKKYIKKGTKLKFIWIDYKNIKSFDIKINENKVILNLPWRKDTHEEFLFNYNSFSNILSKNCFTILYQNKINNFYKDFIDWQKNIYFDTWIFS